MITHKFAMSIFICGFAISPITVYSQDQEAVSSLLSRATATIQAARPEDKKSFNPGRVRCVGVIPKKDSIGIGSGQFGSPGVVTCQTNGNWGSPFVVRAKPTMGSFILSKGDLVFLTYGDGLSSEKLLNYEKLGGKDAPLFSVRKNGQVLATSDSDIRIETDPQNSDVLNSMATSSETRSFLESVGQKAPNGHIVVSSPPKAAPPPINYPDSTGPPTSSEDYMPRVTGTNALVFGEKEPLGYGLYSYALVAHHPSDDELRVYKAFFEALLKLPTEKGLAKTIPLTRINITEVPTTKKADHWDTISVDERVSFVMANYDYDRAAGILGCLPKRTGTGPVIISVLSPIDVSKHPTPVFVEDLTRAEPEIMTTNVTYFVDQVSQDQFWKESTLTKMRLTLRNQLASSASALNMSHTEVLAWVSRINIQHAK